MFHMYIENMHFNLYIYVYIYAEMNYYNIGLKHIGMSYM